MSILVQIEICSECPFCIKSKLAIYGHYDKEKFEAIYGPSKKDDSQEEHPHCCFNSNIGKIRYTCGIPTVCYAEDPSKPIPLDKERYTKEVDKDCPLRLYVARARISAETKRNLNGKGVRHHES